MTTFEGRLTSRLLQDVENLLDYIESTPSIRALITTGKGRFFSNGLDLDAIRKGTETPAEESLHSLQGIMRRLLYLPIITIAAINGHAYGGGLLFALAHDYRICRKDRGWLCVPAAAIGITLPPFIVKIIRTKLPDLTTARDVLLLSAKYTGPQAFEKGIVDSVQPLPELLPHCIALAKHISSSTNQVALGNIKRSLIEASLMLEDDSSIRSRL